MPSAPSLLGSDDSDATAADDADDADDGDDGDAVAHSEERKH